METKERHCPAEIPPCVVPVPDGYKKPVRWPHSRRSIWYSSVPHDDDKRNQQNRMRVQRQGSYLRFPGDGADAINYIRFIEKTEPAIGWGNRTRVVLDIGCGIASFGGYLLDRDVLTMPFAPVDRDAAQTQIALERGIPAFVGALQSRRLPFPSNVYDMVHCTRCLVGWHLDGGRRMLEVDRILRPGGYFVWSSPVVYQTGVEESAKVWRTVATQAAGMCWTLVARAVDSGQTRGVAVFQKSSTSDCLRSRPVTYPDTAFPPICSDDDDADAAWYTPLELCQHRLPDPAKAWPREWPHRLNAADDVGLQRDTEMWVGVVQETYLRKMGGVVDWGSVRNVLDMRAGSGGLAAALVGLPVWVMNVVDPKEEAREERAKMAAIFERGLVGMYHDWCEPMSTFPRTYDLVHADHALGRLRRRCGGVDGVLLEVDRIVSPGGWIIVRDGEAFLRSEVEPFLTSLMWKRVYSHDWDQWLWRRPDWDLRLITRGGSLCNIAVK